jgi:PhnB protein
LREESVEKSNLSPSTAGGITIILGVFVDDVDGIVHRAVAAGATLVSVPQDYDYAYRQGSIIDPFGHHWLIEKKI